MLYCLALGFLMSYPNAPLPPQAPPLKGDCRCWQGEICRCDPACLCDPFAAKRYPSWSAAVAAKRKPTVVFSGCTPRDVVGMLTCHQDFFPGVATPCVVVSIPGQAGMLWVATFDHRATDADIRRAAGLEQPIMASPFSHLPAQPVVDGNFMSAVGGCANGQCDAPARGRRR